MTLEELPRAVEGLQRDLSTVLRILDDPDRRLVQEWYTLKEAAELKGVSYDSLRKLPRRYWPNRGETHQVVHSQGKFGRMYHRSEVAAWLPLTAEEIDQAIRLERVG